LIKFRVDVDYPYPSRIKSFISTATDFPTSKKYLKNSKILAKMFNNSTEELRVYWFFTTKTLPDKELMNMLNNAKHEIALHLVNQPLAELRIAKKITKRKIKYYTTHGTANILTRLIWKRWKKKFPKIPKDFPLKSFHQYPTLPLDSLCYRYSPSIAFRNAKENLNKGKILEIHPEWLFQKGKINRRGPYYNTLIQILKIDNDIKYLAKRKKISFTIARDSREYAIDIFPDTTYIENLKNFDVDVFTFIKRNWLHSSINSKNTWKIGDDNIAILHLTNYTYWWNTMRKKTRNMVRKAEKNAVVTCKAIPNTALAKGIWMIYNETPIRQNRAFPHYGKKLKNVSNKVLLSTDHIFVGSYFENKLVGFVDLILGENIAIISQLLSLQKYWNKAINNSLIAKTVEVCIDFKVEWIMYGRIGNHPSLDKFKYNNGFKKFSLTRYYLPLSLKGKIAIKMGLHRNSKDLIPKKMLNFLLPIYNWISRFKNKLGR
jgi:hypothetical protein